VASASPLGSGARELRENLIRFFERFLAPNIEPGSSNLIGFHWLASVKPLDESSRLVRIISRGEIRSKKRHDPARKIIERNPGEHDERADPVVDGARHQAAIREVERSLRGESA